MHSEGEASESAPCLTAVCPDPVHTRHHATNNNNEQTILAVMAAAAKNVMNLGRMSPASVDSGFDSSFPSSPDSSSVDCPQPPGLLTFDPSHHLKCLPPNKCPLMLKPPLSSSHNPEPCCSSTPSCPSPSSSGYCSSALPSSASQLSLRSLQSQVDRLDLKEPLSVVCDPPEPVGDDVPLVHSPLVIPVEVCLDSTLVDEDSKHSTTLSFADCPSTPSSSSQCVTEASQCATELSHCATEATAVQSHHYRSECYWDTCECGFPCDNDLYDHVIKSHLDALRPVDCLSPTSRARCSPKSRIKSLACKWGDCKMAMSRGDLKKQFIWLEDHFTTRHAGKAQPYRCLIEGCTLRFTLKRALEDHLRSGHEKAREKRSHPEDGESSKTKSCFQWTPMPYYTPKAERDFLDKATDQWLVTRLRRCERTNNPCLVIRPPSTPRGGAAYRKRHRVLIFDIETCKPEPKAKAMKTEDIKRALKDAFVRPQTPLAEPSEATFDDSKIVSTPQ